MKLTCLKTICLGLLIAISSIAHAELIVTENLPNSPVNGTAFDSVTGKYYSVNSYINIRINEFNSKQDFENGVVSQVINLPSRIYGTYFEVINGQLFTRLSTNNNTISVIELSTGTIIDNQTFSSLGGQNGSESFNWGGYSSMNLASDADSLYLFSHSSSTTGWNLLNLDTDLNELSSISLDPSISSMGWGFVAGGYYFASERYNSASIDYKFDLSTGLYENTDFTLDFNGSNLYLRNFDYNASEDTLYISNIYNGLNKVDGIGAILGITQNAVPSVPAPATIAIFALGMIGLASRHFKKQS